MGGGAGVSMRLQANSMAPFLHSAGEGGPAPGTSPSGCPARGGPGGAEAGAASGAEEGLRARGHHGQLR